jgi:hypothetical protein
VLLSFCVYSVLLSPCATLSSPCGLHLTEWDGERGQGSSQIFCRRYWGLLCNEVVWCDELDVKGLDEGVMLYYWYCYCYCYCNCNCYLRSSVLLQRVGLRRPSLMPKVLHAIPCKFVLCNVQRAMCWIVKGRYEVAEFHASIPGCDQ